MIPLVKAEINVLNDVYDFYNINEKIPLKLVITSEQETSGFIKANIECDNKVLDYYVMPVTLKTTKQEFDIPELTLTKSMVGKCDLNIKITDNENNLIDKKIVKVFEVSNLLILDYELSKNELSPNSKVDISGTVKNIRGETIKLGQAIMNIDNSSYTSNLDNSEFSFIYNVPSNIKSKNHEVTVSFEDNYGNKASKDSSFYVNPKPTSLKNLLNKLDFLPGELVEVEALLYDQAGDLIENNADIKIYNPKDELVKEGSYKIIFDLDKSSLPGLWVIKTNANDFKIVSSFNVKEIKDVEFYLEEGILYIKNTGNVDFKDVAKVKVGDLTFTKDVDISPGETTALELSDKVEQGTYDVNVVLNNREKDFKDVNVPRSTNPLILSSFAVKKAGDIVIDKPYILIILLGFIFLYSYIRHKTKKNRIFSREKEFQRGSTRIQEIRKEKESKGFKPKKFKEMNEEELKDYRSQILKNLKNQNQEKPGSLSRKPEDKDSFGFFK